MTSSSYALGRMRDQEAEVTRLHRQATILFEAERTVLRSLGLPERGHVLDVGCGPGYVAAGLRAAFPGLVVSGVDVDLRTVAQAATRIPVERAEATSLPFAAGTFDFVYARLLLSHVPDPGCVVREMRRVARSGGHVVVTDSDAGTLAIDPEPEGFPELQAARVATHRRRGSDAYIGRRLPRLLREQGLDEVRAEPLMVSSAHIGAEAFAAIVMKPATEIVDQDLMSIERGRQVAEAIDHWGTRDDVFGVITACVAGGRT